MAEAEVAAAILLGNYDTIQIVTKYNCKLQVFPLNRVKHKIQFLVFFVIKTAFSLTTFHCK